MYRYSLTRRWAPAGVGAADVLFVMLNPSTADATRDDPTIRRCVRFAHGWGFGGLHVANLFAYRATDPADLLDAQEAGIDIVGPENDATISALARRCPTVVAAWGAHAERWPRRVERVIELVRSCGHVDVWSLGVTKGGHPRHPLYVKGSTALTRVAVGATE